MATTRREALRHGLMGAAGLLLTPRAGTATIAGLPPSRVAPRRPGAALPAAEGRATSVIQVWLWGGPSHLDTFDPKPGAGYDYCGQLDKPIPTNVDGVLIGELLPELAKRADKYSIIRSLTHGINAHETAAYTVQTGRKAGDRLVYPGMGAVVSLLMGYDAGYTGLSPPYVVVTELQAEIPPRLHSPCRALSHQESRTSASATAGPCSTISTPSAGR
jgi:hypothetical protein